MASGAWQRHMSTRTRRRRETRPLQSGGRARRTLMTVEEVAEAQRALPAVGPAPLAVVVVEEWQLEVQTLCLRLQETLLLLLLLLFHLRLLRLEVRTGRMALGPPHHHRRRLRISLLPRQFPMPCCASNNEESVSVQKMRKAALQPLHHHHLRRHRHRRHRRRCPPSASRALQAQTV